MNTIYVHFRYHDLVSGLTGRHVYHYERIEFADAVDMVKYLSSKGYDEFAIRELSSRIDPYNPWLELNERMLKQMEEGKTQHNRYKELAIDPFKLEDLCDADD